MSRRGELCVSVDVDAPQQTVWDALVDWERQREWMLATKVRGTALGGHGVGGGIEGRTGVGPLAFVDTMVITEWEPPARCAVEHTGRMVRGTASFEVLPMPGNQSRVVWCEFLDLPGGRAGRWLWPLVAVPSRLGVGWSLRRFARQVPAG
jgi:carbon monoxide dehydrogenase subunit G